MNKINDKAWIREDTLTMLLAKARLKHLQKDTHGMKWYNSNGNKVQYNNWRQTKNTSMSICAKNTIVRLQYITVRPPNVSVPLHPTTIIYRDA